MDRIPLYVTPSQARKIAKILSEVVELPDGSMAFRKYFKSADGSTEGWYAIS